MLKNGFFSNWKRRISQFVFLGILGEWSFYGIFRCPYAVPYIGCGNCPVVQCPGRSLWMWSWILILVSALFMGRVFCAWACPGGLVADTLATAAFARNKIKGMVKKVFGFGKYLLLAASLWYFFMLNNPRWAVPIRTGEFFRSVQLTLEHADPIWICKTIAVLSLFAAGLIIPHLWCRFFCPTAGALELFSKISLFRYDISDSCTECNRCQKTCTYETRPAHPNCVNCGDCTDACPPDAIFIKSMAFTGEKERTA